MKKLLILLLLIPSLGYSATRNIVPRGTGEGYIGLSTKTWAGVYADQFFGDGSNLTGLATDGELAAVAASTAPLKDYANWNTAYGWGNHAGLYLVAPASFTYQTPLVAGTDYLAPNGNGSNLSGVIQSTATGQYALRVATATYLATAPGACAAGQYISGLTADGTKTCGTPSGAGDVVAAATQTFTGANTFTGSVTVSSFTATGYVAGIHRSSSTIFGAYSTTQTDFIECVTGSTLTITTNGGRVMVGISGAWVLNSYPNTTALGIKIDNVAEPSLTSWGWNQYTYGQYYPMVSTYLTRALSAGSHSFCVSIWRGASGHTLTTGSSNHFWVIEMP